MNSDSLKTKSNKITSIQALRGIAFLGIASFHCGLSLFGPWSVSIFFVLSGFLMMYSYNNRSLECSLKNSFAFSLHKIKKLYPLYLLTSLAMVILEKETSIKILALNTFLLQSWVPDSNINYSLNGVAWFYSDMLFLYLMFPLVRKAIKGYKEKKSAIIVLSGIVVLLSVITVSARYIGAKNTSLQTICTWIEYVCPITRLGDFVVGCNLCYIFINSKNNLSTAQATVWEIVAVIATLVSQVVYYLNSKNEVIDYMAYLYLPIAILCVYLFTIKRGLITKICSNKLLIYIGNLSGHAFLIHRPAAEYLYSFVKIESIPHRIYDVIIFTVSIIITVLFAALYLKIESVIKHNKKNSA